MAPDRDQFTNLFETCSGISSDAEAEACELSLEDTAETQREVIDARKMADVLTRLRAETELTPAADLSARFMERVRLCQAHEPFSGDHSWDAPSAATAGSAVPPTTAAVSFSDLYDLCAGNLPDAEAGAVERRMAGSGEAQRSLHAAGKLAAIFSWLRSESELAPESDADQRCRQRAAQVLDEELESVTGEFEMPTVAANPAESRAGSRSRMQNWFLIAASLAIVASLWSMMYVGPRPAEQVLTAAADSQSLVEFRQLRPQVAALLGDTLLDFESVAPAEIADCHLYLDLADRATRPDQIRTVHLLTHRLERHFQRIRAVSERRDTSGGWFFESVAHAESRVGPAAEPESTIPTEATDAGGQIAAFDVKQRLQSAIWKLDHEQILALTQDRQERRFQLVRLWSLVTSGNEQQAAGLLEQLDQDEQMPTAGRVFLAAVPRSLGNPVAAAGRLEAVFPEVPELAFHIGYLYDSELLDERRAQAWFEQLPAALSDYRQHGQQLARVERLLTEDFSASNPEWKSSTGLVSYNILTEPTPEGGEQMVLHWTEVADFPNVGEIARGDENWSNYEIRFNFRFDELGFNDARIGVLGYYQSHDNCYGAAIGLESVGLRRREVRSWGGHELTRWPAQEPRYQQADGSPRPLQVGAWYQARFRLENHIDGALLAVKVWPIDQPEPESWNLVSMDAGTQAFDSGRIGLVVSNCMASIAELRVEHFPAADAR